MTVVKQDVCLQQGNHISLRSWIHLQKLQG